MAEFKHVIGNALILLFSLCSPKRSISSGLISILSAATTVTTVVTAEVPGGMLFRSRGHRRELSMSWRSPSRFAVDDVARQSSWKFVALVIFLVLTPVVAFVLSFVVPRLYDSDQIVTYRPLGNLSTTFPQEYINGGGSRVGGELTTSLAHHQRAGLAPLNQYFAVSVALERAPGHERVALEVMATFEIQLVGHAQRPLPNRNTNTDLVATGAHAATTWHRRGRIITCPMGSRWCRNVTVAQVFGVPLPFYEVRVRLLSPRLPNMRTAVWGFRTIRRHFSVMEACVKVTGLFATFAALWWWSLSLRDRLRREEAYVDAGACDSWAPSSWLCTVIFHYRLQVRLLQTTPHGRYPPH